MINADAVVRSQYTALSGRIAQENAALSNLKTRLSDAQGAADRRRTLQAEREEAYGRLFAAVVDEQQALVDLYAPLMAKLTATSGTLGKLSFSVTRMVDVKAWAERAEDALIDCRKRGPFYGRGSLEVAATRALKSAWQRGSSTDVQLAMTQFISNFTRDFLAHAPYVPTQQAEFRAWSKQFAHWLFSTDHVAVRYEISYDGVDIRRLSPGTRGIVLDLPRFSGEPLAHGAACLSNMAGLTKSSAEWRRTGL